MVQPDPKTGILADLQGRRNSLAILGLDRSGIALALAFGKRVPVTAYDPDSGRIMLLRQGNDPFGEWPQQAFLEKSVEFTCYPDVLARSRVYLITMPAPLDEYRVPDTSHLVQASEIIGRGLKRGDLVIYETMVWPGCTEELCVPVLERVSGLKAGTEFHYGYSPTRINPGDRDHRIDNTVRVVAGCNEEAAGQIASLFRMATKADIQVVSSVKVAEMAKLMENSQRDLNTALANEWAMIGNHLDINILEALEAAGTKWNFQPCAPGLPAGQGAGTATGHLIYKSVQAGYPPPLLSAISQTDAAIIPHIAGRVLKLLASAGLAPQEARILVLGITSKENIPDIAGSRIPLLISDLAAYGITLSVTDPRADEKEVRKAFGLELTPLPDFTIWDQDLYHGVILTVAHDEFGFLTENHLRKILKSGGFVFDLKGQLRGKVRKMRYDSL
jgi:UDP-N-acetyl-D-galactosamine dehydrogenase